MYMYMYPVHNRECYCDISSGLSFRPGRWLSTGYCVIVKERAQDITSHETASVSAIIISVVPLLSLLYVL